MTFSDVHYMRFHQLDRLELTPTTRDQEYQKILADDIFPNKKKNNRYSEHGMKRFPRAFFDRISAFSRPISMHLCLTPSTFEHENFF